ncbi:MAG: M3 family metallopeptidase [Pseudomonadales bacterium]|nr:M3 family metallopeptidase [Pseudomonadales bacterium]MBO6596588.1 M3 family metallopeptidase [Pseudomonadales bacterium]MBO6823423.1 M3 family metallopeptidase [Pseudomonadales bacterium]
MVWARGEYRACYPNAERIGVFMSNPLVQANALPPFGEISAAHMVPAIEQVLADVRSGIDVITGSESCSYRTVVQAREALEDRLSQVWSPISHLNGVMNSTEIREAHGKGLELLTAYYAEVGQNAKLFEAYRAVRDSDEFDGLTLAQKKVVENALRDFRLSGIELPEAEQARFSELAKETSALNSQFNNNVLDATQAWRKEVSDGALAGVPETAKALMKQAAEAEGRDGWLLTLDAPCYLAVMTYCDDRELRKEMYLAYGTRASDRGPNAGDFDNSDVMQSLMKARLEQSSLLGFEHYAELSVARKMARSADEVLEFLENLADKSRPSAEREYSALTRFASENGGPEALEPWDTSYFSEKLKKAAFDISQEELRPYFPAPKVLEGMFEVVRRLFDIDIDAAPDMPTWHEDVLTYEIRKGGAPIARFYIDLYARQNKRGGAWMDDCRVRRRLDDGSLQLPVAYLTCNFSGPVGDDPALLSHDEVVTLFHEFGHGLHHMMTQVEAAAVSGINGVAWDAVELPSQFMENFCWQAESLAVISGHFKSGDPLPTEMLEKLLKARNFNAAMMMVRQLEFALFDFRLHVEFDPAIEGQMADIISRVREEVAVVRPPAEYAFQHGFSHIFGGGYAAGYYSYKWAEVLSADAFAKFLEDGIFNRQTGEKFLSTILEKGGSEDAMDLFVAFRGREPEVEALLRQDGIAA